MITPEEQKLMDAVAEKSLASADKYAGSPEAMAWHKAVKELSDYRIAQAKAAEVPMPRCEPPEEFQGEPWHWLRQEQDGGMNPIFWDGEGWIFDGEERSVEYLFECGWRYHSVCRPLEPAVFDEAWAIRRFDELRLMGDVYDADAMLRVLREARARKGFPTPAEKDEWSDEEIFRSRREEARNRALLEGKKPRDIQS
jgi:hypothetical protein